MATNLLLALGLVLSAIVQQDASVPDNSERESLVGISGVDILIALSEAALEDGLSKEQLRADVELRLRKAGIHVGSEFVPTLYVNITYVKDKSSQGKDSGYRCIVQVSLRQNVALVRNGQQVIASTWEDGSLIYGPGDRGSDHVRETLSDFIDTFISDYFAANPKK